MTDSLSAIICAAGAGKRMGCPKALCHIRPNTNFLEHIVQTIRSVASLPIVVVTGAQTEEVRQFHAHLDVIWAENAAWQTTHMLESLICGLARVPEHHAVLHWPVDCIGVSPKDLQNLIAAPEAPFAVLAHQGTPGHPLRIASHKAQMLRNPAFQANSLRTFVESDTCTSIEAAPEVLINCNDAQTLKNFMLRCN